MQYLHHLDNRTGLDEQKPSPLTFLTSNCPPLAAEYPFKKTKIMSILNLTPDSFSDGGIHKPADESYLTKTISEMLSQGADIIDIGGESTRPRSSPVSAEDEVARISLALKVAKSLRKANQAISVDTYHAKVAEEAIDAGAHIINDISGGLLDPDMLATVAKREASIILMHMRGTPQTMLRREYHDYGPDLIRTIGSELAARVEAAERAGIRRWRILLDPGFGFAKDYKINTELLRRFAELRDYLPLRGLPWVIGLSRKRFVRTMAGLDSQVDSSPEEVERAVSLGSAGALMAALQGGADIVRVHDTPTSKTLAKVGDALWRS
jgi:2-amino-4-hydroxy-6-hydroxymethyldihydropteridine diphosphokinase/dihydropteroate synthase